MQLTPEHLSAIVYGLKKFKIIDCCYPDNGAMIHLLEENMEEYSSRYPNNSQDVLDLVDYYEYKHPTDKPDAIALYKLAQCYQYNSAESPEWEKSEAKRWTDSLMIATIQALPAYNAAKWTI